MCIEYEKPKTNSSGAEKSLGSIVIGRLRTSVRCELAAVQSKNMYNKRIRGN
jgi:hypothetical protein